MSKPALLNAEGVVRLDRLYRRAYADGLAARETDPLAYCLHLPKLPELLSLSVAAIIAPNLIGADLVLGRAPHDLETGAGRGVAVKGTGPTRWITLTAADRLADILIWIDYTDRIVHGGPVSVLAVRVRDGLTDAPTRLTRAQLERRARRVRELAIDPSAAA